MRQFPAAPCRTNRYARATDIMISWQIAKEFAVAQIVVRDLEEEVKLRLKRRAERHGRSMEEEVRHILRNASKASSRPIARLGSRIAGRFCRTGLMSDLPEIRGHAAKPVDLKS